MRALSLLVVGSVILAAVVVVILIGYRDGDEEPREQEVVTTTVDAIVDVPPQWYRRSVTVTATAVRVSSRFFLLEGGERAIVLAPEPGSVRGEIDDGEQVSVTGVVRRLDRLQVERLRRLLEGNAPDALRRAPTTLGDPFVSGQTIDATA
ncbi:MAG TPA: hypothetical protein VM299_04695 [Solirubrobacteraceae bacterium]|jgi:hypothetical protein|nr:hypothetical protein [Solirubrobacteraceae bacterium]